LAFAHKLTYAVGRRVRFITQRYMKVSMAAKSTFLAWIHGADAGIRRMTAGARQKTSISADRLAISSSLDRLVQRTITIAPRPPKASMIYCNGDLSFVNATRLARLVLYELCCCGERYDALGRAWVQSCIGAMPRCGVNAWHYERYLEGLNQFGDILYERMTGDPRLVNVLADLLIELLEQHASAVSPTHRDDPADHSSDWSYEGCAQSAVHSLVCQECADKSRFSGRGGGIAG